MTASQQNEILDLRRFRLSKGLGFPNVNSLSHMSSGCETPLLVHDWGFFSSLYIFEIISLYFQYFIILPFKYIMTYIVLAFYIVQHHLLYSFHGESRFLNQPWDYRCNDI